MMEENNSTEMRYLNLKDSQGKRITYALGTGYMNNVDVMLPVSDTLEFLKQIPSSSVDLVVTSPPYNMGKIYEERKKLDEYLEYMREVASECVRVLKDSGNLCWEVGNYVSNKEVFPLDFFFYRIFKEWLGLKLRNRIIWRFAHGLHASLRFSGRYETILWFTKTDFYTFNLDSVRVPQKYPGKTSYSGKNYGKPSGNPLGKNPGDIWDVVLQDWEEAIWDIPNVKSNHPEKTEHPAQYPIELVQRIILALTNEGDIILDPFGGVGSAMLAAVLLNRKAISVDRDKEYQKIAYERLIKLAEGSLKIRKIGTKVYVPTGKEKVSKIPESWLNDESDK